MRPLHDGLSDRGHHGERTRYLSEDITPLPDAEKRASADELAALMQARRSVRRFSEREVDGKVVERIVEMAATAPMGIPPWDVGCVAVCGRAEVRRIAAELIKGYEGFLKIFRPWLLAAMRPFVGQAKYDMFAHFIRPLAETYLRAHGAGRDVLFYDAPALLIFHHSPMPTSSTRSSRALTRCWRPSRWALAAR